LASKIKDLKIEDEKDESPPIPIPEIIVDDLLPWMRARDFAYAFGPRRLRKTTILLQCMRDDIKSTGLDDLPNKENASFLFFGNTPRHLKFAKATKEYLTGEQPEDMSTEELIVPSDFPVEWISMQDAERQLRGVDTVDYLFMYFDDVLETHEKQFFKIVHDILIPIMEVCPSTKIKLRIATTGRVDHLARLIEILRRFHSQSDAGVCAIVPPDLPLWKPSKDALSEFLHLDSS
jgi:adenylate kinase family enzyme